MYFLLLVVVCWRCSSDRDQVDPLRSRHVRFWPRDCRSHRRFPCPGTDEGRRRSGCGSDPREPPGLVDWNGTRGQGHRKPGPRLLGRRNRSRTLLIEAFPSFVPRCRHRRKCRRACPEYPVALSCDSFSVLRHCKWRLHFPSFYQTKTDVVFFL